MIFYESFYEAAQHLPQKDADAFINAVVSYGCTGKEPEVKGVPMAMFMMAKPLIDANAERRKNGAKGGRPKENPNARTAGKFINFAPSGENWNDAADKIMAAQK